MAASPDMSTTNSVKTAGASDAKGYSPEDARLIIEGLGGPSNIETVNNCITRLRCNVKDISKVDEAVIKKPGRKASL